jgi:type I restriction enzyme S subunit
MSKVRISDLIQRRREQIKIEDDVTYKQVTIRTKHKGVVLRGTQKGTDIGTKNQYVTHKDQFILSCIDARQGAFGIVPAELEGAIITNDFWCFDINEQLVLRDFFYTLIQAPDFDEACKKASIGTTNRQRINEAFFLGYELEIPPIEDQAAAVRQIMAARQHLGLIEKELTHQATLLTRLRQAVLREAVQGRLVPQDATDEPAPALLARIRAEKQRLVKEKKLRAEKPQPPLSEKEVLYELPQGWAWVRLEEVSLRITDGTHQSPHFTQTGVPFLFVKHIINGAINFANTRYVSEADYEVLNSRCPVEVGDILYTAVGSYGVAVPVNTEEPFTFQRHIAHIKPCMKNMQAYIVRFLNSPIGLRQAHQTARGIAQKTVALSDLSKFVIPLPPLPEQQRIVAKVTELMAHCTALEAGLLQARQAAEALHAAALRNAFAPVSVEAVE